MAQGDHRHLYYTHRPQCNSKSADLHSEIISCTLDGGKQARYIGQGRFVAIGDIAIALHGSRSSCVSVAGRLERGQTSGEKGVQEPEGLRLTEHLLGEVRRHDKTIPFWRKDGKRVLEVFHVRELDRSVRGGCDNNTQGMRTCRTVATPSIDEVCLVKKSIKYSNVAGPIITSG